MKQLLHVPNIILSAIDDDGDDAGDDADDNDGDANYDYDQGYEIILHLMQINISLLQHMISIS